MAGTDAPAKSFTLRVTYSEVPMDESLFAKGAGCQSAKQVGRFQPSRAWAALTAYAYARVASGKAMPDVFEVPRAVPIAGTAGGNFREAGWGRLAKRKVFWGQGLQIGDEVADAKPYVFNLPTANGRE
jgi:hypothetical protein